MHHSLYVCLVHYRSTSLQTDFLSRPLCSGFFFFFCFLFNYATFWAASYGGPEVQNKNKNKSNTPVTEPEPRLNTAHQNVASCAPTRRLGNQTFSGWHWSRTLAKPKPTQCSRSSGDLWIHLDRFTLRQKTAEHETDWFWFWGEFFELSRADDNH